MMIEKSKKKKTREGTIYHSRTLYPNILAEYLFDSMDEWTHYYHVSSLASENTGHVWQYCIKIPYQ